MQNLDWSMQIGFHQSPCLFSRTFFKKTLQSFKKLTKKLVMFVLLSVVRGENKALAAIVLSILTIRKDCIKKSNRLNLFKNFLCLNYSRERIKKLS